MGMRSLHRILLAAVVIPVGAVAACSQAPAAVTGADVDAGDSSVTAIPDASDAGIVLADAADATKGPGTCTRTLSFGEAALKLSAGDCDINQNVTRRKGVLTYACGDGPAKAEIGTKIFKGSIAGDSVQLTLVDDFDYGACSFTSTETLTGSFAGGKLSYAYREAYQASSPTTCGLPDCTATGTVNVAVGTEVQQ